MMRLTNALALLATTFMGSIGSANEITPHASTVGLYEVKLGSSVSYRIKLSGSVSMEGSNYFLTWNIDSSSGWGGFAWNNP